MASITGPAVNGVASISVTINGNAGNGYTLKISGGDLTPVTTNPFAVIAPPPPTITGEQVMSTYLKHNKKGKPIGKPVVSIVFDYSTAMNAGTVRNANNYQVDWISTKKVKKKIQTVLHRVSILSATPNATNTIVTLVTSATQSRFAKGGQITVIYTPPNGVSSAAGVPLPAGDSTFTILPKAKRIAPG